MFRKRDGVWHVWGQYNGYTVYLGQYQTYEAAKKQLSYMNLVNNVKELER